MDISQQNELYTGIKTLIKLSRTKVYEVVNFSVIQTYWQIGKRIFEEQEKEYGQTDYGKLIVESLEKQLTSDFGKGFDYNNLIDMRRFFITFPVVNTLRPLLSWSHYRLIINLEEAQAQIFYMNKAADNQWSVQELTQKIESQYYKSTFSDKMKESMSETTTENELQYTPSDLIKDPYVIGFLNINPVSISQKQEFEQVVIDKIKDYLLGLTNGFCFVTRQKHIIARENEHYYIDIVFYNYLLRCFILVNFRLGELTAEDELMMNRYVEIYDDKFKPRDDNPTFGILIGSQNGQTEVKYALLNDRKQVFSSLYQMVIPSKEEFAEFVTAEVQYQTGRY
jgi:predicted nuclease of restriction endonuclease-like (RecB) superfamily